MLHCLLNCLCEIKIFQVAKSRDVEVLEGKPQYLEFAGNLVPVTKSGDQLAFNFYAFRENRLPFTVRVKDQHADAIGRVAFMRQPKVSGLGSSTLQSGKSSVSLMINYISDIVFCVENLHLIEMLVSVNCF